MRVYEMYICLCIIYIYICECVIPYFPEWPSEYCDVPLNVYNQCSNGYKRLVT